MHEDELRRQIAELVADNTDRATPPPIATIRRRGRRRRARLASGAVLLIAAVAAGLVAVQGPLRRQVAPVPVVIQPPRPVPDPRPHQWVYTKELRVEYGSRKPWTHEHWIRVDGRKFIYSASDRRVARTSKVRRERMDFPSSVSARWPRCPPGKREQLELERVRPAAGLAAFFPNPAAVPTDPDGLLAAVYQLVEDPACAPILVGDTVQDRAFMLIDGMLQTVLPPEVRAALYRALAKIPEVTVAQGATDAAGRRGVAMARAAAIEGPGSSDWLRLEIILDNDTYHYLGARHIVTRDHFTPNVGPRSKGTWFRKGQVLVSRAQLALAVVDAPCQRPGETTVCASYLESTWVGG
jgi:hypothetical protein